MQHAPTGSKTGSQAPPGCRLRVRVRCCSRRQACNTCAAHDAAASSACRAACEADLQSAAREAVQAGIIDRSDGGRAAQAEGGARRAEKRDPRPLEASNKHEGSGGRAGDGGCARLPDAPWRRAASSVGAPTDSQPSPCAWPHPWRSRAAWMRHRSGNK
eukprot:358445-Chlamydomonas_euryale.AAC.19